MRVVFTAEVLADEDLWPELDDILQRVADGWHLWELPDLDATEESAWLQDGRRLLRELLEVAARRSAWQGQSGVHSRWVFVAGETMNGEVSQGTPLEGVEAALRLSARTARRYLSQPLCILMENTESDGLFLNAVLDILGHDELGDLRGCQPPALVYDSPGGSELPKRIKHHLDDPAWGGVPRRLFVLADSDRLTREGDPGQLAKQVKDLCEERGVPYHVLRKRCVENYLPQEALDAWAALPDQTVVRSRVAMMTRLDTEQRDHFPMKKGFSKGIPEEQEELFAVPRWNEEDRAFYCPKGKGRGFGSSIINLFRDHRDAITPKALRQRCDPLSSDGKTTELDRLVARICTEL